MSEPKQADHPIRLWLGLRKRHAELVRESDEILKHMNAIRGNAEINQLIPGLGVPKHFVVDGTVVSINRDSQGIHLSVVAEKAAVI